MVCLAGTHKTENYAATIPSCCVVLQSSSFRDLAAPQTTSAALSGVVGVHGPAALGARSWWKWNTVNRSD